jgi:tRNA pseudouridine38-40 synthase
MYRYKAVVEYDGSGFNGWQSQPNGNTIQQCIQNSFKEISLGKIEIFGSGRTDSGKLKVVKSLIV